MLAGSASAADTPDDEHNLVQMNDVIVLGSRGSLAKSRQVKQDSLEIVDTVEAADINKLPDFNVTDALSRITGVQILRDRGEGAGVAVRGLTQMETLLNGREIFTAGNGQTAGFGRNLDFADLPSEMISGIDVYKTSSAEQIEGGLGGTVALRTHRPFDFSGREMVASVRVIQGDLVQQSQPQLSSLMSDRWQMPGGGEMGALLNLAYQKRAWREDQKSAGSPIVRTDLIPGLSVVTPNGMTDSSSRGYRERHMANLVLEWLPTERWQFYAEGSLAEFLTVQNTYQISAPASTSFANPVLFSGTNDLQGITWNNAAVTTAGAARDTRDRTAQLAAGGIWSGDRLTLKSDVSYTRSRNDLYYSVITLGGTAQVTQNLAGGLPSSSVTGAQLGSLNGYTSAGMWYATRPFEGDLTAVKFDGEYQIGRGALDTVSFGVRSAQRHATDAPGQISAFPVAPSVANAAPLVIPYNNYLVGNPALARGYAYASGVLGITAGLPSSNPLGSWDLTEDTQSAYAMAKFKTAGIEANAGLRAVHTRESVTGSMGPAAGPYVPVALGSTDSDYLPSANLRFLAGESLYLRGALSKSIARQNFDQLSPSITLNPIQLMGSAGNPALRPVRSDNLDVAVEKYFGKTGQLTLTGFVKRVDGFVTTVITPETYGALVYQVSRPQNTGTAGIRGAEFAYQEFYDFLPPFLKGLGLQANYTYVDSGSNYVIPGQSLPLQSLSRRSYNLAGLYEQGNLSARIAYNWRDRFVSGVANISGIGMLPVYTAAYGWLDASLRYRIGDDVTLAFEGMNLLKTVRYSYYGVPTRPQSMWVNDRQLGMTLTVKY